MSICKKICKKIILCITALTVIMTTVFIFPSSKAYELLYPECFMCTDSTFEDVCISRTMKCSSNNELYFEWFRVYNDERYEINVFDSDGMIVANCEGDPPISSIGHITIGWDNADYKPGEYTIEVHKMFYSYLEWREAPTVDKYYITLQSPTSNSKKVIKTPSVKLKGAKKSIKVTLNKKVSEATGIQVKCKLGKKTILKKLKNTKATQTIKKLKKGGYKVTVRAYAKSGKKTTYSKWTKVKKVTVK